MCRATLLNAAFIALMPLRLRCEVRGTRRHRGRPRGARELPAHGALDPRQPGPGGHRVPRVHPRFFQENRLLKGGLQIGGLRSTCAAITCPILNIYAPQDHLVPPAASRPLEGLTGSRDYSAFEFDGGHIGIYVSRSAQELLPRTIAQWLRSR